MLWPTQQLYVIGKTRFEVIEAAVAAVSPEKLFSKQFSHFFANIMCECAPGDLYTL